MGLLYEAAKAWKDLNNKKYIFVAAHKGKKYEIELAFNDEDFPHLVGMHYAADVDFGLNKAEYYGDRLVNAIMNKILDSEKIEQSRNWDNISGRLTSIINLQNTLDNDFRIFRFNKNKVRVHSDIKAKYVIKNLITEEIYFVFLDESENRFYCKSTFKKNNIDYSENQTRLTILQKTKIVDNIPLLLYRKELYTDTIESQTEKS